MLPDLKKLPIGPEVHPLMAVALTPFLPLATSYSHIASRFDERHKALWLILDPKSRPCFYFELLTELRHFLACVERLADGGEEERRSIRYFIVASKTPGVFNLGGDLELFARCVTDKDYATLRKYAVACIDTLYPYIVAFQLPLTTVALVQGNAFGGGFEVALAADLIVAEKSAQMGFPEVLFNLFPGMGAYNLLQRRLGVPRTERMLLNGKMYRADELHAEGIVDILAEDGQGENAVYGHIVRHSVRQNAREGVQQVRRKLAPVRYEDMLAVGEIWVETAMRVGPREIKLMERLTRAQERTLTRGPSPFVPIEDTTA
ncbi:MAG: enoyl-CoA hydratase [Deltaproteobacteria bacterium]|nr:enoyl-CoA hydratase [Deltaproteobacteria bacterium]